MRSAIARALRTIRATAGVTVTIRRGKIAVENVTAGVGRTAYEVTDEYGAVVKVETRDYLFDPADYAKVDPQNPLPQRNDCIEETGPDSVIRSHQLTEPVKGDGVYRWQDQFRTGLRVHTVRTDELRT